jgi:hypothetical protein
MGILLEMLLGFKTFDIVTDDSYSLHTKLDLVEDYKTEGGWVQV